MGKPMLTVPLLLEEARRFSEQESAHPEPTIFGVTDGKAIGTYLEHKFQSHLEAGYVHAPGNSASGIDLPGLGVDMKVTSIRQPQSSCPFKHARQKVFGLGYSLLIFVYEKSDNSENRTATLDIRHTIFVDAKQTGDFQMTRGCVRLSPTMVTKTIWWPSCRIRCYQSTKSKHAALLKSYSRLYQSKDI